MNAITILAVVFMVVGISAIGAVLTGAIAGYFIGKYRG